MHKCPKCGRVLEEGQVCPCTVKESELKNNVMNIFEMIKGLFLEPVKTIKRYTRGDNFKLSVILTVITGILGGLLAILLVKRTLEPTIEEMLYGTGILNAYTTISSYDVPYFRIFFMVAVLAICLLFLYGAFVKIVAGEIFGAKIKYKEAFNFVNILGLILLAAVIFSLVAAMFSPMLVMAIFTLALFLIFTYLVLSLREVFKLPDYKVVYAMVIIMTLNLLSILLSVYILPKF